MMVPPAIARRIRFKTLPPSGSVLRPYRTGLEGLPYDPVRPVDPPPLRAGLSCIAKLSRHVGKRGSIVTGMLLPAR